MWERMQALKLVRRWIALCSACLEGLDSYEAVEPSLSRRQQELLTRHPDTGMEGGGSLNVMSLQNIGRSYSAAADLKHSGTVAQVTVDVDSTDPKSNEESTVSSSPILSHPIPSAHPPIHMLLYLSHGHNDAFSPSPHPV